MVTKPNGLDTSGIRDDDQPVVILQDGSISEIGDDGIPTVEPSTIQFEPDASEQRGGRRGRPRGSKNVSTKATKENANDLTAILASVHFMLATLTKVPELNLEEAEARKLAEAIAKVNAHYGGFVLPEKYLVWANFTIALGTVYGPRIVAYSNRVASEVEQKKASNKPQVVSGVIIN